MTSPLARTRRQFGASAVALGSLASLGLLGCSSPLGDATTASPSTRGANTAGSRSTSGGSSGAGSSSSQVRSLPYSIEYQGRRYDKTVEVYVPGAYRQGAAMDVLYLMHGSGMRHDAFAATMRPQFDEWIAAGDMEPMLVVFPTYYPDDGFVVADYSQDYPLNHFFATDEVTAVIELVESTLTTHARDTSEQGLQSSRRHRAFGGYSMGGITTWDVLVAHPQSFAWFMPMAGDSWIGRTTGASDTVSVADTLASGLQDADYSAGDFQVIAMVGGADGTKSAMQAQIEQLRRRHGELFTEQSLLYWENAGGGHSQESLEIETRHGMAYLFAS